MGISAYFHLRKAAKLVERYSQLGRTEVAARRDISRVTSGDIRDYEPSDVEVNGIANSIRSEILDHCTIAGSTYPKDVAILLQSVGLTEKAVKFYERALGNNGDSETHQLYAIALEKLGRIAEANKQFEEAKRFAKPEDKKDIELDLRLTKIKLAAADDERRREELEKTLGTEENAEHYLELADLFKDKDTMKALGYYERAVELDRKLDTTNMRHKLALRLRSEGENRNFDEAQRQYEKILELNPTDSYVFCELGGIFWMRDKDYKKAREFMEKASSMKPDDDSIKRSLEWLEKMINQEKRNIITKAIKEGKIKYGEPCNVDFKTGEIIPA